MVSRRTGASLRVLDEAFVPDENKAEVRKRLARRKERIEGVERIQCGAPAYTLPLSRQPAEAEGLAEGGLVKRRHIQPKAAVELEAVSLRLPADLVRAVEQPKPQETLPPGLPPTILNRYRGFPRRCRALAAARRWR
jgi:hypothetical protein